MGKGLSILQKTQDETMKEQDGEHLRTLQAV